MIAGGNKLPDKGENFVAPTIVKMPERSEIVKEETLAPILYINVTES